MAGLNPPIERSARSAVSRSFPRPRLFMTWEDWLTFGAALVTFLAVSISIQQAEWVRNMPALVPTALGGLLIGLIAARVRLPAAVIHPLAVLLGAALVILVVQSYAEGATFMDRLEDFRVRMHEWYVVVREGDISNDDLPFITLVHGIMALAAYIAAWSIYRWHSPWLAVIPGGAVILSNIAFLEGQPSAAFVAFLFGSLWLIARIHLQRNQARWNRFRIEYPEFISVPATQLTVALSVFLVVGAWLIPLGAEARAVKAVWSEVVSPVSGQSDDLVRLFHNVDSRKGANLHSFGNTLPIQGNVKLGTKTLYEVKAGEAGLLRATSYDVYTGKGWKTGSRDQQRIDAGELAGTAEGSVYKERQTPLIQVTVLDKESILLSPGVPAITNVDSIIETPKDFDGDVEKVRSRRELGPGDTYNMVGSVSTATEEQLASAGTDYPEWVQERYLQLPDDLPDRVRAEAESVAAAGANPYAKARLVEGYLREFPFDLAVESAPPGEDVVDFFLFEQKRGYFDYQSSAMAVMLRSIGIPARVAVGYILDPEEVGVGGVYTVRKDDAYSWVEVFFPEYGWVNFNPTRDRPEGGAGSVINGADVDITTPSLEELFQFDEEFEPIPGEIGDALSEPPVIANPDSGSAFNWMILYVLGALLAVAALVALSLRTAWNWGMGELEGRARLWAKVQRLAGWAHLGAHPNETPREWSRRMGATIDHEPEAIQLADAYEEVRYGRPDLQRIDDEETRSAYVRLRGALASTILRRGRKRDAN